MLVKRRMQMNLRTAAMLFLAALIAGLMSTAYVQAATTKSNTANTLKVTPVRTDVQIEPGTSHTVPTTVTNLTGAPITVRPIENDFVAGDERGTPALILDADKYAPTHSLKRFMAPLPDVTIPANKSAVINVLITVPKDAQPGGYFGAIRFAPTSADGGGQVNLSGSVASLILMTVPGDAIEKLKLTNFEVQQNSTTGTIFQTSDNLSVLIRFENQGSVQEGPFGKISVKKGNNVVYSTDFNSETPREMVLPDSARRWDVPLHDISGFGYYTVYGTFTYGSKNQTIEVNQSFWVVPLGVAIGAVVGVIILIALVIGLIIYIRNRRVRGASKSGGGNFRIK